MKCEFFYEMRIGKFVVTKMKAYALMVWSFRYFYVLDRRKAEYEVPETDVQAKDNKVLMGLIFMSSQKNYVAYNFLRQWRHNFFDCLFQVRNDCHLLYYYMRIVCFQGLKHCPLRTI